MTTIPAIVAARLDALRISPKTVWLFVHLTTEDRLGGIGEATVPNDHASVIASAKRWLADVIGMQPHLDRLRDIAPERPNCADWALYSALDMACRDLAGQRLGQPVHRLLGDARRKTVRLYANINRRTTERTPLAFVVCAKLAVEHGYDIIKLAPFDEITPSACEQENFKSLLRAGLERIAATREAIGPDRQLRIDCHWRFNQHAARQMIEACRPFALDWVECPMVETTETLDDIKNLRRLANGLGMRLAGLEKGTGIETFEPSLEAGAYDVIMPDVKYLGGLALFSGLDKLAERFGVLISPHNPTGPVCHAASLHVSATLAAFDSLEFQFAESPLFDDLVAGSLASPKSGSVGLPSLPGLGIRWDRSLADRLRLHDEPTGIEP